MATQGSLHLWGNNQYGQQAFGDVTQRSYPTYNDGQGFFGTNIWFYLACGDNFFLGVDANGGLWTAGKNDYGQLGNSTTTNSTNFVSVVNYFDDSFKWVSAGGNTAAAINNNEKLYVWGDNTYGQLGLGHTNHVSSPTHLAGNTWKHVAVGMGMMVGIDGSGRLWTWGRNTNGELGDGTTSHKSAPVQINSDTTWTYTSAGGKNAAAIKDNDELWVWGDNSYGQLGQSDTVHRSSMVQTPGFNWLKVSVGYQYVAGLQKTIGSNNGTIWAWGRNTYGQLGQNDTVHRSTPTQITDVKSISANNWWQDISAGYATTHAVISVDATAVSGYIYGWGLNDQTAVGDATNINTSLPTKLFENSHLWTSLKVGSQNTRSTMFAAVLGFNPFIPSTPTPTATATETPSPTPSPSYSPTPSPSPSPSESPSPTPSPSYSPTPSPSPSPSESPSPTPSPSDSPTPSPSPSPSESPSPTPSPSYSPTPSPSPSPSESPSPTPSPSYSPTPSPSPSPSESPSPTPSPSYSPTPSPSPSPSESPSPTPSPSYSPTPSPSPSPSESPSPTPSPSYSNTPSPSPSESPSPTPSPSPSESPSPTPSPSYSNTPSPSPSESPSPTPSPSPSESPSPTPSPSYSNTPSPSPSESPSPTPSPSPSESPSPTPSPSPSESPSPTPSPSPSESPSPTPSPSNSNTPSPSPSESPSPTPSPSPSESPSPTPSPSPSESPSPTPSPSYSNTPSPSPSESPSPTPSPSPSESPSPTPSPSPSESPSPTPSPSPSESPSPTPSPSYSNTPSPSPSESPSPTPSPSPSESLSPTPSPSPSESPSPTPSPSPSESPSPTPSPSYSNTPSPSPSESPSPTPSPSPSPSESPSPTPSPSYSNTPSPSPSESPSPTPSPSPSPSESPSPTPSPSYSNTPSPSPSESPSPTPSPSYSNTPSPSPSESPSPTPSPSYSNTPSPSPSQSASLSPTPSPSYSNTPSPSPSGSASPTPSPSPSTSNSPTPTPSPSRSSTPTPSPSGSGTPTPSPSRSGTPTPTPSRSRTPTPTPSQSNTTTPTPTPSATIGKCEITTIRGFNNGSSVEHFLGQTVGRVKFVWSVEDGIPVRFQFEYLGRIVLDFIAGLQTKACGSFAVTQPSAGTIYFDKFTQADTVKVIVTPMCPAKSWSYTIGCPEESPCDSGMDVAFIVDYTGSMGGQIDTVKANLDTIFDTIAQESDGALSRVGYCLFDEYLKNGTSRQTAWAMAGCGGKFYKKYLDLVAKGAIKEYGYRQVAGILAMAPFDNIIYDTITNNWIAPNFNYAVRVSNTKISITPGVECDAFPLGNGQNIPEPSDLALFEVIQDNFLGAWRSNVFKLAILITDAIPGSEYDQPQLETFDRIDKIIAYAKANQIRVLVMGYVDLVFPTQEVPIGDPRGVYFKLAKETNGLLVGINDVGQIQNYVSDLCGGKNVITVPCGVEQQNGGRGLDYRDVNLGATQGEVTFTYDALGVADRFQLILDGKIIFDSGYVGNSSSCVKTVGAGSGSFKFIKNNPFAKLTVVVESPCTETRWTWMVSCPEEIPTGTPSPTPTTTPTPTPSGDGCVYEPIIIKADYDGTNCAVNHICNWAMFDMYINGKPQGIVSVNNLSDGGPRYNTFNLTAAQVNTLSALDPLGNLNFQLICYYNCIDSGGGCGSPLTGAYCNYVYDKSTDLWILVDKKTTNPSSCFCFATGKIDLVYNLYGLTTYQTSPQLFRQKTPFCPFTGSDYFDKLDGDGCHGSTIYFQIIGANTGRIYHKGCYSRKFKVNICEPREGTPIPTGSPTSTPTASPTGTFTPTPTRTPIPTLTPIPSVPDGRLFLWGLNTGGQAGTYENRASYSSPTQVYGGGNTWQLVSATLLNSAATKGNGTLWGWGVDTLGRFGTNSTFTHRSSPIQTVATPNNQWMKIDDRGRFSVALKYDGTLWGWGQNINGAFGASKPLASYISPVQITDKSKWHQVCVGADCWIGLQNDATVWGMGTNGTYYQLGVGDTVHRSSPVQIAANAKMISYSSFFGGYINEFNELWMWGRGDNGQLGNEQKFNYQYPVREITLGKNWTYISCGYQHACGLKADGSLWCWGANNFAQLGTGSTNPTSSPVQTALRGNDWIYVAAGERNTAAIKSDFTLWCWGLNNYGQIGDIKVLSNTVLIPKKIFSDEQKWYRADYGTYHIMAVENSDPTPSPTFTTTPTSTPSPSASATPTTTPSPSPSGTTTPTPTYSGTPSPTPTASGTTTPSPTPSGTEPSPTPSRSPSPTPSFSPTPTPSPSLSPTPTPSPSNTDPSPTPSATPSPTPSPTMSPTPTATGFAGNLYGMGRNHFGQLGNNSTIDSFVPVLNVVPGNNWDAVSGNAKFGAAIRTDETLWIWGENAYGKLGNLTTATRISSAVQVIGSDGIALWKTVSCGTNHAAAIRNDGSMWTWGSNVFGELGRYTTTNLQRVTPNRTVDFEFEWTQVSCGDYFTAAIKSDGTLWSFGINSTGQLGRGFKLNPVDPGSYYRSSPVQITGGGYNWYQVSCGGGFAGAIKTDGSLWLWGDNSYGKLGTNDSQSTSSPIQTVMRDKNWSYIHCGENSAAGIRKDGTLWVWGSNKNGTLGDGTRVHKSSPVQIYGANSDWRLVTMHEFGGTALKNDGTTWQWGQIFKSPFASSFSNSPVQITAGYKWLLYDEGDDFFVAVGGIYPTPSPTAFNEPTPTPLPNGYLYLWGDNKQGQLGSNDTVPRPYPNEVYGDTDQWTTGLDAGYEHFGAVKKDGTLWLWGDNYFGEIGDNTIMHRSSPVQTVAGDIKWYNVSAGKYHSSALTRQIILTPTPSPSPTPTPTPTPTGSMTLSCGALYPANTWVYKLISITSSSNGVLQNAPFTYVPLCGNPAAVNDRNSVLLGKAPFGYLNLLFDQTIAQVTFLITGGGNREGYELEYYEFIPNTGKVSVTLNDAYGTTSFENSITTGSTTCGDVNGTCGAYVTVTGNFNSLRIVWPGITYSGISVSLCDINPT